MNKVAAPSLVTIEILDFGFSAQRSWAKTTHPSSRRQVAASGSSGSNITVYMMG
jgi:hypothetical protein